MSHSVNREIKQRVACDLLAGVKIKEIEKKYALGTNVIYNWRKNDEEFIQIYRETADNLIEDAKARLKGLVNEGLDRLQELIWNEDPKISLEALRLLFGQHKLAEYQAPQVSVTASASTKENVFQAAFGDV